MQRWTLDSIPWNKFDPSKVDPELLAFAKGAAMVESNAGDYVHYLKRVFAADPEIHAELERWGEEEKLHGAALRRWAEMADPSFDYDRGFDVFLKNYRISLDASESIRGSRSAELVARCVVETGTSGFYSALRDAGDEPAFREICRRIAGDEVRHFNLFLSWLNTRYDDFGFFRRVKTILERSLEAGDEELSFAYFAANDPANFDPGRAHEYSQAYMTRVSAIYNPRHFAHTANLLGQAAGVKIRPWLRQRLGQVVHSALIWKYGG